MAVVDPQAKKKISKVIVTQHNKSAGARDPANSFQDETTCFAIPGSNLPARHCNVDIAITAAVATDLTVYLSIHDGKMYQNVYGQGYICHLYTCPHAFNMYIPKGVAGSAGWDEVKFTSGGKPCNDEVTLISWGKVEKSYDKSKPFEWVFGSPGIDLTEGGEYYEGDITQDYIHRVNQHGGFSESNSGYINMGQLTDWNWKQEMGSSQDGKIYLCGGILYPTAKITSDITASAIEVTIPGLNLANYYYPGAILKGNDWMSLNREGGYFKICSPSRSAEYLNREGQWRDVKNTENDRAVEEGAFEQWGFRLDEDWKRLILMGKEGVPDDEYEEGIGSMDGSSSNSGAGSGGCCM